MKRGNSCIVTFLFSIILSFFVFSSMILNVSGNAFAQNEQVLQSETSIPGPLELGMVGITSTQTARLNIVQIPVDPISPSSSPCAVVLIFYDSNGNLLNKKDNTSLSDGQAAYLDLNGHALMLSNPAEFNNGRAQIRAEVMNLLDPLLPPDPSRCVVSLEVFNTATGATSVLWAHPLMPTLSMSFSDSQVASSDVKFNDKETISAINTMAAATPSPKISVSPMSLKLGSVKTGGTSSQRSVNIKNTGKADLSISSISITGTNAAEFSQSNTCTIITPGSVCAVSVTFFPEEPFGNKTATLAITSNDTKKSVINVKLSGLASPPKISVSPKSIQLGSVIVGNTSTPKTITIKNTGISDLVISDINITGTNAGEFSQTNDCTTIQTGGLCTVSVSFTPTTPAGTKSATISISSNDPKKPIVNMTVKAKAVGSLSPTLISMAVTPANPSISTGATQQFTAIGTYSDGITQNLTTQVTWNSSTASISTVNSSGLATAVAAGTAAITATMGSISGSTTLTVTTSNSFKGSLQGSWSGACDSEGVGGGFSITIDANGNVTGSYYGSDSGSIVGTVDVGGNFSASGVAGGYVWLGTFSLVNNSLNGSGTWSGSEGSINCSGAWQGNGTPSE
jgi:hypothetical protein